MKELTNDNDNGLCDSTIGQSIESPSHITIPLGGENAVFRRVCDVLDKALVEWDSTVSALDRDHNPNTDTIILNIPDYLSERLIYEKRVGKNEYWEEEVDLYPGHTHVVKLQVELEKPCIYGVWIGQIKNFWDFYDGALVFYGIDKKMYAHPGSSWGDTEGEWEVFSVEGGWDPREFSSDAELDDSAFDRCPGPGKHQSPVPFTVHPEPARQQTLQSTPTTQSSEPIFAPISEITVAVGEENAIFQKVCDTVDVALAEWDEKVSDFDKDHNPSTGAIGLNIPNLSERIIYGERPGQQRYWEGDIYLWPGDLRVIVKLSLKYGEPCIYGVPIGMIDEFRYEDGADVFYGQDKRMWVHPACSWGFREGEWQVFTVKGGWNLREFSSNIELDAY